MIGTIAAAFVQLVQALCRRRAGAKSAASACPAMHFVALCMRAGLTRAPARLCARPRDAQAGGQAGRWAGTRTLARSRLHNSQKVNVDSGLRCAATQPGRLHEDCTAGLACTVGVEVAGVVAGVVAGSVAGTAASQRVDFPGDFRRLQALQGLRVGAHMRGGRVGAGAGARLRMRAARDLQPLQLTKKCCGSMGWVVAAAPAASATDATTRQRRALRGQGGRGAC